MPGPGLVGGPPPKAASFRGWVFRGGGGWDICTWKKISYYLVQKCHNGILLGSRNMQEKLEKGCFYRWRLSCIGKCVRVQCRRRCHRRGRHGVRALIGLTLAPGSRVGAPAGVLVGQHLNSSCVPFERHICIVCRFNQHTVL